MKARLYLVFLLVAGTSLMLSIAVQGAAETPTNAPSSEQPIPPQNADLLDFQSEHIAAPIAFTPTVTAFLPAVLNNFVACMGVPTLLSPANESDLDTVNPLYQWQIDYAPNATQIKLQVALDSQFNQIVYSALTGAQLGENSQRFASNLQEATTYYWRALLLCNETEGPHTEVRSFTTGSGGILPESPTLAAPMSGTTLISRSATFEWTAVSGAQEYLLSFRPVGEVWQYIVWVSGTEHTTNWLPPNTLCEWWVSARNDYGLGADSVTWQFTTGAGRSPSDSSPSITTLFDQGTTSVMVDR